jgi:hypothetical protein
MGFVATIVGLNILLELLIEEKATEINYGDGLKFFVCKICPAIIYAIILMVMSEVNFFNKTNFIENGWGIKKRIY